MLYAKSRSEEFFGRAKPSVPIREPGLLASDEILAFTPKPVGPTPSRMQVF